MDLESGLVLVLVIIIHHEPCSTAHFQDLATSNYASHHLRKASSQSDYDLNPTSGVLSLPNGYQLSLDGDNPSKGLLIHPGIVRQNIPYSWHLRQGISEQQPDFGASQPPWLPSGMSPFLQQSQLIGSMKSLDPQMSPSGSVAIRKVGGTVDALGMLGRLMVSRSKIPQTFPIPEGTLTVTGSLLPLVKYSLFPSLDSPIADGMPDLVSDILGTEVINNPLTNPGGTVISGQEFGQYGPREKHYGPRPNSYRSLGSYFKPVIQPYKSGIKLPNGPKANPYGLGNTPYEPETNAYGPGNIVHGHDTKPYGSGSNPFRLTSNPYIHDEKNFKSPINPLFMRW